MVGPEGLEPPTTPLWAVRSNQLNYGPIVLKENAKSIKDTTNVKNDPTIKDLLLHTAGFSYNFLGDIVAEEYHNIGLFYSIL